MLSGLRNSFLSNPIVTQNHGVHTSFAFCSQRKKRIKAVRLKKTPSPQSLAPAIYFNKNMTVKEISNVMGRDIRSTFAALRFIPGGELYDSPDAAIDDIQILTQVLKRCGFKPIHAPPSPVPCAPKILDAHRRPASQRTSLFPRSPIVTIMGHVDHGKTTLLDTIRSSRIVDQEYGGITQHIGAFKLNLQSGQCITFIDTPGHAAFSTMRARGASVTDIIILVVSADDGVMLQTIESLEHAKLANVPVIVAINKVDKPSANITSVLDGLMEVGIAVEALGGDVQAVPISALKGIGINELLDAVITQAELLELQGDLEGPVEGVVIESRTDPARGKLASAIIQHGTLLKGNYLVAGTAYGKVRGLYNDLNQPISKAVPGSPVQVVGWKELPSPGDVILQVESESRMKDVNKLRLDNKMEAKKAADQLIIDSKRQAYKDMYRVQLKKKWETGERYRSLKGRTKEAIVTHTGSYLPIIIKGDVDGSIEAIMDVIDTYDSTKCDLDVVHTGVGSVTVTDVELASTVGALIYSFNVSIPQDIYKMAAEKDVSIHDHHVVYSLFDDLKKELTSRLPPSFQENITGEATVQEVYKITERKTKVNIAGCRCIEGLINRKHKFRIMRNGQPIHEGNLRSLHHFKNEVDTVKEDTECGMRFEDKKAQFEKGDLIQCYTTESVTQVIDWDLGFG